MYILFVCNLIPFNPNMSRSPPEIYDATPALKFVQVSVYIVYDLSVVTYLNAFAKDVQYCLSVGNE